MKILLDECCPRHLIRLLPDHHVYTVASMRWNGLTNGDLIAHADPHFDVFITLDTNLRYQQDLTRIRMAILLLVVPNNRLSTVLEHARRLAPLLGEELAGRFLEV